MNFLYNKGFLSIEHIHSGNIFVEKYGHREVCKLGGYENRILGYRPEIYKKIARDTGLLNHIDIIMFGNAKSHLSQLTV